MSKVLVFGLDGGTWDLIKPWADEGELPTFKKLMENGAWGILESTWPPATVPAWPSMLTGKKPEKLGLYYFVKRDTESYEPRVNRQMFDGALWQMLHNHGKQCYVINVPATEPPKEDETGGVFIAGPIMNLGEVTNDPRIKALMEKTGYQVGFPRRPSLVGDEESPLTEVISRAKKQFALVEELLHESWDLLFYVNFLTDWVSHIYWKYLDETHPDHEENEQIKSLIKSFYKEIDRFLNLLAGNASNLFVVSDHGFGPLYYEINLNGWLAREGFQNRRPKDKRSFSLSKLKPSRLLRLPEEMARKSFNLLLYKPFQASFEARRREAASRKVRERGLISLIRGKGDFAKKALKENPAYFLTVGWLLGAGFVLIGLPSWRFYRFLYWRLYPPIIHKDRKPPHRKSGLEQAPVFEHVDWSKTRAYSITYAGINVNLRGREPSGCVEPSEYERVREEIINRALQLRDKEGRQVVEGAYRAQDIYDNPSPISFPDIVLKFKDMKYRNRVNINLGLSSDVFTKWEDSGGHKSEGIFLAYGSGIKRGYKVDSAKIHDLVPTILHVFGLPIPRDVDGRVLKEIFQEKSELARREVTYQEPEAADEKERLRERTKEKIRELKASRRI